MRRRKFQIHTDETIFDVWAIEDDYDMAARYGAAKLNRRGEYDPDGDGLTGAITNEPPTSTHYECNGVKFQVVQHHHTA